MLRNGGVWKSCYKDKMYTVKKSLLNIYSASSIIQWVPSIIQWVSKDE